MRRPFFCSLSLGLLVVGTVAVAECHAGDRVRLIIDDDQVVISRNDEQFESATKELAAGAVAIDCASAKFEFVGGKNGASVRCVCANANFLIGEKLRGTATSLTFDSEQSILRFDEGVEFRSVTGAERTRLKATSAVVQIGEGSARLRAEGMVDLEVKAAPPIAPVSFERPIETLLPPPPAPPALQPQPKNGFRFLFPSGTPAPTVPPASSSEEFNFFIGF